MKKKYFLFFLIFWGFFSAYGQKIKYKTIQVTSPEEFINAIGSDRIIRLKTPKLLLSVFNPNFNNTNVQLLQVQDGFGLQIQGVKNLKIIGLEKNSTKILSNITYAQILRFKNCENITLENLEAGHAPVRGYCTGGVLGFYDTKKITVNNTVLFGSGTEGITMEGVSEAKFNQLTVKSCTYGIMTLNGVRDVEFNKSRFTDNQEFDLINVFDSENIRFKDCQIDYNRSGRGESFDNYALFNAPLTSEVFTTVVVLTNCKIEDNFCQYFCRAKIAIQLENSDLNNNIFEKGYNSNK